MSPWIRAPRPLAAPTLLVVGALAGGCGSTAKPATDPALTELSDDASDRDPVTDDDLTDAGSSDTDGSTATDGSTTDDVTDTSTDTDTGTDTDDDDDEDDDGSSSGTTDPCPPDVECIDTVPFVVTDTTTGAASTFDAYSCSPSTDESGPEQVYEVILDEAGYLATEVYGLPDGVDVDVHVLASLDADDCVDRGHWTAGALLMPGTYYVVVDSWVDGSGDVKDGEYTLGVNVTHRDAFEGWGLDADVLERGLFAFDEAWFDGETDTFVYGLIDFSMPSDLRRFFVMDLLTGDMLFDEYVSHGEGSSDPNDIRMASDFSNIHESHQSSLGMMRAAETYYGSWGYSLRLDGLDPVYNDQVRSRAIVIHPADYTTESFVNTYGYTGRSWGCPAVDPAISADLIDTIADGALVLSYGETNDFLTDGKYMPGF